MSQGQFSQHLLKWYDRERRDLPWRQAIPNPYHTWLSEIMLQQTTVATVIPYFHRFLHKWPTVKALAAASLDDVLVEWQGLGYYSRARNLHKCAQLLSQEFPSSEDKLVKLPGIGPYTAAAIASIAFEQPAAAVDGNVMRVLARYFAFEEVPSLKGTKEKLKTLLPTQRHGDFTQALMELGALVCRPKNPQCSLCPLQTACKAYASREVDQYPRKLERKKIPTRYATAFFIRREDGAILLRKRPPQGLLGGMMEVPTTPWEERDISCKGQGTHVRHTFTHFHLEITLSLQKEADIEGIWVHPKDLKDYALPTVMKKVIRVGMESMSGIKR